MNTPAFRVRSNALTLFCTLACISSRVYAADAPPTTVPAAPVAAPVPAVVAIARPSAAEIAKVNAALEKLLVQTDPDIKAIYDKYPQFAILAVPRNNAIIPALNPGFAAKHNANDEVAKKGDIDVLFMGDSITDFWRNAGRGGTPNPPYAGKVVFDKYFGGLKIANFGIAGDTTQGVLFRLQNGEGQGFQPKVIMLMIGTNNAGGSSSAEIAEGVGAVILEMRKDFPTAKILLLGIFPRGTPDDRLRKTVLDANPLIAKLADDKNVFYLDIGDKFLNPDGVIMPDIMSDRLHPTEKGYEIWAEAIKGPLAELLGVPALPPSASAAAAPAAATPVVAQ